MATSSCSLEVPSGVSSDWVIDGSADTGASVNGEAVLPVLVLWCTSSGAIPVPPRNASLSRIVMGERIALRIKLPIEPALSIGGGEGTASVSEGVWPLPPLPLRPPAPGSGEGNMGLVRTLSTLSSSLLCSSFPSSISTAPPKAKLGTRP